VWVLFKICHIYSSYQLIVLQHSLIMKNYTKAIEWIFEKKNQG
jgi:hypothetical protein